MDAPTLTAGEIGRLVPAVDTGAGSVNRESERFPFGCVQRLCHDIEEGAPAPSKFYAVQCCDLSRNGISFLLPTCPTFRCAVIELGNPSKPAYWAIKVLRTTQQDDGQYVVGCGFIRRIDLA